LNTSVPVACVRFPVLRPIFSVVMLVRLLPQLWLWRPAIVHVHSSDFTGFWEKGLMLGMARASGCRTVLHLHGGSFDLFLEGLGARAGRWAARVFARADRIIVLSRAWCPAVARFAPRERLDVVPNAIDVAAFAPPEPPPDRDATRILFLGMLSERKGMQELQEALRALRDAPWALDVVGGEEGHGERARWEAAYAAAGLADRVRFHGPQYGAAKLHFLHRDAIFVLPSRSESFGIANLEAMAAGMAVVSTRVGAIPEYLDHGVHGLLVPPRDAAALAAALRLLLADAGLRARCGAAARERARDFDWARSLDQLARVYAAALAARRPGG
jgi:glycosyltransferase involved in cell wall biosynthesis